MAATKKTTTRKSPAPKGKGRTPAKATKPDQKAARATPKEPKAPKGPREIKTDTPAYLVRRIICEHPDATIPEVERLARREMPEIDGNTIRGLYQGAVGFLRVARSLGYTLAR